MSEHQKTTQAIITGNQTAIKEHQTVEQFELFLPNDSGGYANLHNVLLAIIPMITDLQDRVTDLEA